MAVHWADADTECSKRISWQQEQWAHTKIALVSQQYRYGAVQREIVDKAQEVQAQAVAAQIMWDLEKRPLEWTAQCCP